MDTQNRISNTERQLILEPIGYIATPFQSKAEAPHQPDTAAPAEGIIELIPERNYEQALEDLDGMEKIWLLYWFDRNPNWKPKVLVPLGDRQKRGVFATRSPHRPNPIGLSLVDLLEVSGRTLRVGSVDLLDGTPILDMKPYLPHVEAHPNARAGWIEEALRINSYALSYSDLASSQLEFLKQHGIELESRIERVLARDPRPHPYKRISEENGRMVQAIRGWRIYFAVSGDRVSIEEIRSGYAESAFSDSASLSDAAAQIAFREAFGTE